MANDEMVLIGYHDAGMGAGSERIIHEVGIEKIAKRLGCAFVRIPFGIVNDAPGWFIGPDGKPHPVPGGPSDPWQRLSKAERNDIAALAIQQIASLLPDRRAARQIEELATEIVSKQGQRFLSKRAAKASSKTQMRR